MNIFENFKEEQQASEGLQIGDKLGNHEIMDIRRGGMGIVYITYNKETNRVCAVKTFQDKYMWNEEVIDRFINEAETWVNLEKHTNIIFAYGIWKFGAKPYIFIELAEEGDLSQYIGKLDIPHALDFAIQFCCGMDYAYKKCKVIHRDIKPQNALVNSEGILKVTDFGLVKAVEPKRIIEEEMALYEITVSRGMGTWPYMPPEQFPEEVQRRFNFRPRDITVQSDIYAFGVTFYQMFTTKLPFSNIDQIFSQEAANPTKLTPDFPEQLDFLLMKCLRKNPDQRYQNFEEIIKELVNIYDMLPAGQKVFGHRYSIIGKEEPLTTDELRWKGISLSHLGKYERAISCYDRALEIDSGDADIWYDKTVDLLKLRKYQDALDCCDKSLGIDPSNASAWNGKGEALRGLGRYEEAIDCYDKALKIEPLLAEAWHSKGNALRDQERYREEIVCYNKALVIDPTDLPSWYDKGIALIRDKKYKGAIECFDGILKIDPRHALAWYKKGFIAVILQRYQEAVRCLQRFIEIAPTHEAALIKEANEMIFRFSKKL